MDIKILKNTGLDLIIFRSIDDDRLIMTAKSKLPYDRGQLINYYIYDLKTNQQKEILEDIKKYDLVKIINMNTKKNFIYFCTRSDTGMDKEMISIVSYDIFTDKITTIYEYEDYINLYEEEKEVKLFILNYKYLLIQHGYLKYNESEEYKEIADFDIMLYDCAAMEKFDILDERFKNKGIDTIYRVADSIYAIKLGTSLIINDVWQYYFEKEIHSEYIGIFNVHQLVSDIAMKQKSILLDILECERWNKTLHDMKFIDKYLIYQKISYPSKEIEYVFYNYKDKMTYHFENSGALYRNYTSITPCIINSMPFIAAKIADTYDLINIKNDNHITVLNNKGDFVYASRDVIIFQRLKKNFFNKKGSSRIEGYYVQNLSLILQEKGFIIGFTSNAENVVLITSNTIN